VLEFGRPPEWLMVPASAVLDDIQGGDPIAGLRVVAYPIPGVNGLTLALEEPSRITGELSQLPDDLDPDEPTDYGGGNCVPRSLVGPELLILVADILQEISPKLRLRGDKPDLPAPSIPTPRSP
jgi:hypothetical protein